MYASEVLYDTLARRELSVAHRVGVCVAGPAGSPVVFVSGRVGVCASCLSVSQQFL